MTEGILLRIGEAEGDVPESQNLFVLSVCLFRILRNHILDLRSMLQNRFDTFTALQGTWHSQDHHLRHHQEIQHHQGIPDNRCNVANLQFSGADAAAAEPVYNHNEKVNKQEGETIQVGKSPVCLDRCIGIVGESGFHAVFFPLLVVESSDNPDTGYVLQQDRGHFVQQLLQLSEQRGCAPHNKHRQCKYDQNYNEKNQSHFHVQTESQGQGNDENHRHRQYHLNKTGQSELNRCNIRYRSGGDRSRTKMAEIIDRQFQRFLVKSHPHVFAHLRR